MHLSFPLTWLFILCCSTFVQAEPEPDYIIVDSIRVEGNKKTREKIMTRELNFGVGDTISLSELSQRLEYNKLLLMNTSLFSVVRINLRDWKEDGHVDVIISVIESWFIWPIPIFELADRNFNVWWVEQNHKLNRTNFGIQLTYSNFTGRRDQLNLTLQYGYTHKYQVEYKLPFINRNQTIGLVTDVLYSRNREIGYISENNKVLFYRDESNFIFRRFRAGLGLTYRPGLRRTHSLFIQFHDNVINDTVANELNRDFFLHGNKEQRFVSMRYNFTYDHRDIRPYPKNGEYAEFEIRKDGFGLFHENRDALVLSALISKYWTLNKHFSLEVKLRGSTNLQRQKQDYFNYRGLGYYGDYLRGYEYYVVDGLDAAYFKTSLRFELLNKELNYSRFIPFKPFKIVPLKLYITLNNDLGYVNDPYYNAYNPLVNHALWGGGVGFDIVIYYDKVFQIEYSTNQMGERALFLHTKLLF